MHWWPAIRLAGQSAFMDPSFCALHAARGTAPPVAKNLQNRSNIEATAAFGKQNLKPAIERGRGERLLLVESQAMT